MIIREQFKGHHLDGTQADAGSETDNGMERNPVVFSPLQQQPDEQPSKRSHTIMTIHSVQLRFAALPTEPAFLRMAIVVNVNALLDESSTKT